MQKYPHCNSFSLGCAHKWYFSNQTCPCITNSIGNVTSCKHNTSGSQLSINVLSTPFSPSVRGCYQTKCYSNMRTSSSSLSIRSGIDGSSTHLRPLFGTSIGFVSIFGSDLLFFFFFFVVVVVSSNCFALSKTLSTSSLFSPFSLADLDSFYYYSRSQSHSTDRRSTTRFVIRCRRNQRPLLTSDDAAFKLETKTSSSSSCSAQQQMA